MLVFLQKSVIPPLNNFPGLTTIKTLGYLVSRKRQDTHLAKVVLHFGGMAVCILFSTQYSTELC